jgi:hypothetical protein
MEMKAETRATISMARAPRTMLKNRFTLEIETFMFSGYMVWLG